ncbi:hypothetical protein BX600DRAFT_449501 [Xylariales sp. PMI_506]|nr:hypothetical protein BX600DRAFT_449501 [Xylariales sp. PMI_506]
MNALPLCNSRNLACKTAEGNLALPPRPPVGCPSCSSLCEIKKTTPHPPRKQPLGVLWPGRWVTHPYLVCGVHIQSYHAIDFDI